MATKRVTEAPETGTSKRVTGAPNTVITVRFTPNYLLLEGDAQVSGDDCLLLEGDVVTGVDFLKLEGDQRPIIAGTATKRITEAAA